MPDLSILSVCFHCETSTNFLHKFGKKFWVLTCSNDDMEMCCHDTVGDDLYVALFVVSVQGIDKELLIGRCTKDVLLVVATVIYVVETIRYVVAGGARHGK